MFYLHAPNKTIIVRVAALLRASLPSCKVAGSNLPTTDEAKKADTALSVSWCSPTGVMVVTSVERYREFKNMEND